MRLLSAALIIACSLSAMAQEKGKSDRWSQIQETPFERSYFDGESIQRLGQDSVRLWVKNVYTLSPQRDSSLNERSEATGYYWYDEFRVSYTLYCKNRMYLRRQLDRFLKGSLVKSVNFSAHPAQFPPQEITPEGLMEFLYDRTCKPTR